MKKILNKPKIVSLVFAMLLLFGTQTVFAEAENLTEDITLVIHKRMYFDSDAKPDFTQNTGIEQESVDNETYGLNDVVFSIYDGTDFVRKRSSSKSLADIQKEVLNEDAATLKSSLSSDLLLTHATTATVNGEDGVASVLISREKLLIDNPAFLIFEESAPLINGQEIKHTTSPLLVILPILDPKNDGSFLNEIHLYPKNFGFITDKPEVPKKEPPKKARPDKGLLPQTGEVKTAMVYLGIMVIGYAVMKSYQLKIKNNKII